jgi:serine/threonine protein kinase/CheY-like chemotaxis protein
VSDAQSQERPDAARVLVVDDNLDNRELLRRRLARRGFDATAAASGAAALDLLSRETFDAVLLDIEMPDMSGLEVLTGLRERFTKTELPVLMATARTESDDMVEAFRLGANDYVTKPLDFPIVVARLETALAVRRELAAASTPPLVLALDDDLPPGAQIDGRYRIGEQLGIGGFAVVYAGTQTATGLPVAIKVLRAHRMHDVDAATELARFELEMRVIARVAHPAVVRLVDSGTLTVRAALSTIPPQGNVGIQTTRPSRGPGEGTRVFAPPGSPDDGAPPPRAAREHRVPYIVMERLRGPNLADVLAESRTLPASRAVDILLPILDGMHVVHEEGVVHRDAKPSNIVLCETGPGQMEPKILDFGIAKLFREERPALTRTASVVGTPAYVSPEQATASKVDGRSDQYSLATVLFECLTGRTPCEGTSSLSLLQQIADGRPARQAVRRADLPTELRAVLDRALQREPARRFPDLRAFGDALLPFASDAGRAHWERLRAQPPSGVKPRP